MRRGFPGLISTSSSCAIYGQSCYKVKPEQTLQTQTALAISPYSLFQSSVRLSCSSENYVHRKISGPKHASMGPQVRYSSMQQQRFLSLSHSYRSDKEKPSESTDSEKNAEKEATDKEDGKINNQEKSRTMHDAKMNLFPRSSLLRVWPPFFNIFAGYRLPLTLLRMRLFYDKQFEFGADLKKGTTVAAAIVAKAFYEKKFDDLIGVVDSSIIEAAKSAVTALNDTQLEFLNFEEDDIYLNFILDMFFHDGAAGRLINMVTIIHVFKGGAKALKENLKEKRLTQDEAKQKVLIGNLQFSRIATPQNESEQEWIITALNFFQPAKLTSPLGF